MSATPAEEVVVLLFARLREEAGTGEVRLPCGASWTVADVAAEVETRTPGVRLRGSLVAVNEAYADAAHPVRGGDRVAFLPPIAGG